jgi:hypothetical protein
MELTRRELLAGTAAAAASIMASGAIGADATTTSSPSPREYKHRVQFGCWINDMRNAALPRDNWPAMTLDDQTERDIIACLDLGKQSGYNQLDVWGLFAAAAYPLDIRSAFSDKDRRPRVDRILAAARDRGIRIIFGTGVYSWGFNQIIAHDPAVRGNNPQVMCASSDASLAWQQKLIDVIVSELGVDGFHLESADQGRCTCEKCTSVGNVAYHALVSTKTADYIRSKYPGKLISCVIQGWNTWGRDFDDGEKKQLAELSRHVDVIWDQGHRGTYVPPPKRKEFIATLKCDYGTSGGFWVYPPPRWNRLRWFMPYARRTGTHLKELYAQGGRGVMCYQGPTINPGVEVNIAVGGKLMMDASASNDDVVQQVLEAKFQPNSAKAMTKLCDVFSRCEAAYFAGWDEKRIAEHDKVPPPGELHLAPLFGDSPGGPTYLSEPFLDREGRKAYREALLAAYSTIESCDGQFNDDGRIARLKQCLIGAISDLDTLRLGKGES